MHHKSWDPWTILSLETLDHWKATNVLILLRYCFTTGVKLSYHTTFRVQRKALPVWNLLNAWTFLLHLKIMLFRSLKKRESSHNWMSVNGWVWHLEWHRIEYSKIYLYLDLHFGFPLLSLHICSPNHILGKLNSKSGLFSQMTDDSKRQSYLCDLTGILSPVGFKFNWKKSHIILEIEGPLGIIYFNLFIFI